MAWTLRAGLWRRVWALTLVVTGTAVLVAAPPADKNAAAADAEQAASQPEPLTTGAGFVSDRTVIWLGRTQVIPFRVTDKADVDRIFTAKVDHPQRMEILLEPSALAGRDIGFVRVRGLAEGETRLTIGDASLAVRIAAPPTSPAVDDRLAPVITAPASGSVVWGALAVGVELFEDPVQMPTGPAQVSVLLADGTALPLLEDEALEGGPWRRLAFELDTAALEPGPVKLVATVQRPGQTPVSSRTVLVHVVRPAADRLVQGEAESLVDVPRPDRYGGNREPEQRPLNVRKDKTASGGQYVSNYSARPPMTIPVTVETQGWYQLMLQVGSDYAGGAYPTVGVRVDDDGRAQTMARLARRDWHRMAVGHPVRLEPGEHKLIAYFENDFNARGRDGGHDRNLRIDSYELLRLDELPKADDVRIDASDDPRLSIVMTPVLDGRTLSAGIRIDGRADWLRKLSADAPTVSLLLNGKPIMSQRSATPTFRLDRGHMSKGRNTLELEAKLDGGPIARSGPQTVTLAAFDGGAAVARRMLHFSAVDDAWSTTMRAKVHADGRDHRRVAAFYSSGHETLSLPDDLTGSFRVALEARGDSYQGHPVAEVTLVHGETKTVVGSIDVGGGFRVRSVGAVDLPPGPKQLQIAFTNDKYDGDSKKDRNLYIAAVQLNERAARDTTPPTATLIYPESGHDVYQADAVIVDTADDRGIKWAELVVDGQATGLRVEPVFGEARLLLPLVARDLSPGQHNVAVRVCDQADNTRDTPPVRIAVLAEPPKQPTRYARAVRLLNRFAYGPEPDELAAVLTMGETEYLKDRLWRGWDDHAEQAAWRWASSVHANANSGGSVTHRVVHYALASPNPVRMRFVLWANNHFSSWLRKTGSARKLDDFTALAQLGPAPFSDMLLTSATSPAMLYYLDQHRSFVKRINENYAREIMELHSLGVGGGYTQEDVTQLAHLITGWTVAEAAPLISADSYLASSFRYVPGLNDPAARDVFGMRFPAVDDAPALQYDRVHMAVEMLASHPSTAHHISRKLAEQYLSLPAPDKLVDDLAAVFMRTGGDLREVVLALAQHPAFVSDDLPPRIVQPLDFGLRLGRVTNYEHAGPIIRYLNRSAVGLFDRDTPDGYPEEDQAYTDSNMTLQRWRLARDMEWALFRLAPAPLRGDAPEGVDPEIWRQRLVDAVAVGMTGQLLGERSNKAAMDVLRKTEQTGNERILLITGLIAQLPEAMLR